MSAPNPNGEDHWVSAQIFPAQAAKTDSGGLDYWIAGELLPEIVPAAGIPQRTLVGVGT